jgi:hypothetical protein
MRRLNIRIVLGSLLVVLGGLSEARAQQAGLMPVPVFRDIQVQSQTAFDAGTQLYTYSYTVINPASNTGNLRAIHVDITRSMDSVQFSGDGLTIQLGPRTLTYSEYVSRILARLNPPPMVAVGIQVPSGWTGALGARGFAAFAALKVDKALAPGQQMSGFALISSGLPMIRQVECLPHWVFLVQDHDKVTPEEEERARVVENSLVSKVATIGPSAIKPGSLAHWDQMRDDLNRATQLKWVTDPALATTLVNQLASARRAADVSDAVATRASLQRLLDSAVQATLGQIRPEARDLVALNTRALIAISSSR